MSKTFPAAAWASRVAAQSDWAGRHTMQQDPDQTRLGAARWADSFSDFDDMADRIATWDVAYQQLGAGPFRAEIGLTSTPRIQLLSLGWNRALSNHGSPPTGKRSFALPLRRWGAFGFNGMAGRYDGVLTARGSEPFHLLTRDAFHFVVVSFDLTLLNGPLHARFGCDERELGPPRLLHGRNEATLAAAGQALDALARAMANASHEAIPKMESNAVDIVLSALAPPDRPPAEQPRHRLARLIEDILSARLSHPPSIGEMCALTGATERTLHLAFREAYGTSPVAHLRRLRLNAARRALLRGAEAEVSAVATRFGFFHFGRFAGDYAKLFGELPSAALNRGRNVVARGQESLR